MSVHERKKIDTVVALVCWSLWKNRNAWAFADSSRQFSVERLAARILDELQLWSMARRGTAVATTATAAAAGVGAGVTRISE